MTIAEEIALAASGGDTTTSSSVTVASGDSLKTKSASGR